MFTLCEAETVVRLFDKLGFKAEIVPSCSYNAVTSGGKYCVKVYHPGGIDWRLFESMESLIYPILKSYVW